MADRPNLLLTSAAIANGVAGLAAIFASEELLRAAGAAATPLETALAQLLGAALFGLAMLDWTSRFSRLGGLFGRPLVVANLTHTATGALMLVHLGREIGFSPWIVAAFAGYATFAVLFGATLFRAPRPAGDRPS
jgi:hypothetical protein